MRFPTITHYMEAVANIESRLRTLSDILAVRDKSGSPIFYSSRGYVTFIIERSGVVVPMRCFTSAGGYGNAMALLDAQVIQGTMAEYELFVFDDNEAGDYYSILIENSEIGASADTSDSESDFIEGVKPFEEHGVWGYRNDRGAVVIMPQYDAAGEFSEGRAVVRCGGLHGLINRSGELVLDIIYDEISWDGSAIAYVDRGGRWGCFDRSARCICECKYDWVSEFASSLLLVRKYGKYGYIDLHGTEVIPLVYDSATSFDENGIAGVRVVGEHLLINTQGKIEK